MSIFSVISQVDRIKTLALVLSLTSIGAAVFSLETITNRLLQRDAYAVGMHWAEDIEANLINLEVIFSGKPDQSSSSEILRQLSSIGRIYRYVFIDPTGKTVFDTSTYSPSNQIALALPNSSEHELSSNHHGEYENDNAGMKDHAAHSRSSRADNSHSVTLKKGDGSTHPKLYAYVDYPVTKDRQVLGSIKLYLDQTETQALMSDIVFAFLAVLSGMVIFTFGAPVFLYLRNRTKENTAQQEFKQQQDQLDAALSIMHQGFCMFDDDGHIILSNDRFATMYNLLPEQLKPGITLDELVDIRVKNGCFIGSDALEYRRIAGSIKSKPVYTPRTHQLNDGRYIEICNFKMEGNGWFTIHEDITEQVVSKNELTHRNERLDTALKTMTQGLCMFDADERIVVCNSQYAEIYGISSEQIQPGTHLQDILELRVQNGTYGGADVEEYRQERTNWVENQQIGGKIHHLKDGRYIEIRDHPMANGGWLSIHEDVTERHESEKKIKFLAKFDALTGLPNRTQIREKLKTAIRQSDKSNTKMALLYIDLDGFKEVNDTLGHPVGDRVLLEVGSRITQSLGKAAVAGRLSGDEFIVVVKEFNEHYELKLLGDKICSALSAPIQVDHNIIEISASVGISVGPPENGDVETLVQFSDLALYQAKADGGNSYRFFEEGMYARAKERQQMASDLRHAITKGELLLHYQPQVDLSSGKINGYEALVRWQHGTLGMISPLQFIGLAEETGQINEIGEWVLRTACEYAASWPNREKISVNISPVQFKRQNIVEMVKKALQETGLEPARLELEITESVLIQNPNSVVMELQILTDMGVSIAIDDFGTGFSSLSYLTTIPFNKIKIDKSFVVDLCTDSEITAIVAMIIGLGTSLGKTVTAEGIETPRQHELLCAAGCDQGQGYFYGKPLPEILEMDQPATLLRA
ncbi:MAG: EAL domain-containing protein [Rhizobiaceae bacterium]